MVEQTDLPLFLGLNLADSLTLDLRRMNPWWEGKPLPVLPLTRRHLVGQMQRRLELRLAPALVVRGPRQRRPRSCSSCKTFSTTACLLARSSAFKPTNCLR